MIFWWPLRGQQLFETKAATDATHTGHQEPSKNPRPRAAEGDQRRRMATTYHKAGEALRVATPRPGVFVGKARGHQRVATLSRGRVTVSVPERLAIPCSCSCAGSGRDHLEGASARGAGLPGAIAHEREGATSRSRGGEEAETPENVKDITSIRQLIDELERATDKLVIVSFHATWCSACRKVQPKVVNQVKNRAEDILLLKVRYDTNKSICKTLGVRKLPYFHFYRGSQGRLADFSASAKTFHRITDAIEEHGTPRCTLGENHIVPHELEDLLEENQSKGGR